MTELVSAAADYLNRGLRVIALTGKTPNGHIHPNGLKNALVGGVETPNDYELLYRVFGHKYTTGVGVLTGQLAFVVDIDGEEGAQAWRDIAGDEYMPTRWVAKTGRGLHLWFSDTPRSYDGDTPVGRRTRKLAEKLDLKGEGGYVAAPPSRHPDGHLYQWLLEPDSALPPMAPWSLLDQLDREDALFDQRLLGRETNRKVRHLPFEDGKFWASWGFAGVYAKMREAGEGNRNATLYWAAYTLAEDGATEEDYEQLVEAAREAGLTARETKLTIRSARKAYAGG